MTTGLFVLLPGMMCDARLFTPQIAALSRTDPIHLAALSGPSTIAELADDVLANAPPNFALAGISMGGIVVMEIFARSPERGQRMALMDTNPRTDRDATRASRDCHMARTENGELATIMRQDAHQDVIPNYLTKGSSKDQIQALRMEMALELGKGVFRRQSNALQKRPDQREVLRPVNIPTWVLCGQDDRSCPVQNHKEIHSLIAGSVLAIIKSAGHLPNLEQPDTITAALRRWMEE